MIKLAYGLLIILTGSAVFILFLPVQIRAGETGFLALGPGKTYNFPEGDSAVPELFAGATERLFELGLPDPRRGEYRELEIKISSVWGGSSKIKIHGWLLAAETKEKERFVIGWNGVLYPVISVGEKKNLREDVLAMISADEQLRARHKQENPDFPFYRWQTALPNGLSASHQNLLPLKASLLLKLGETGLAAQVWDAWTSGLKDSSAGKTRTEDPFLMLASEWTWALFDAALTAHMQGDDREALPLARFLAPLADKLEAEAEKRGFKKPEAVGPKKEARYLNFLQPLPILLADQERRGALKNRPAATVAEITANPDKPARIAALIGKLDEVAARQWGQPGGISLGEDPVVKALVEEGDEAVEPLLKVIETDERLTRSVSFHRDFFSGRHLVAVSEAAYGALIRILKTNVFSPSNDNSNARNAESRRELAGRIRAYLDKYGRKTNEERWFAVLADDQASAEEWNQAAANIITPVSRYNTLPPSWAFTSAPVPAQRRAGKITLRGDALRAKNSPSVSELFTRRMLELSTRNPTGFPSNLWTATNFALALLAWDGRENPENLSRVVSFQNDLKSRLAEMAAQNPENASYLRMMIVNLYLKRCETDDPEAFSGYAEWIAAIKPAEAGGNTLELFRPLWRYAEHPAMAAAAKRLFGSAEPSLWLPLIDGADRQSFDRAKLLESPLVNVRSFREAALAGLADKTVVGALLPRRRGQGESFDLPVENTFTAVIVGAGNASSATISVSPDDRRAARTSETVNLRVCDAYASALARLDGAPKFEISWTEKERDRAITELKNFLRDARKRFESPFNTF